MHPRVAPFCPLEDSHIQRFQLFCFVYLINQLTNVSGVYVHNFKYVLFAYIDILVFQMQVLSITSHCELQGCSFLLPPLSLPIIHIPSSHLFIYSAALDNNLCQISIQCLYYSWYINKCYLQLSSVIYILQFFSFWLGLLFP